MYKRADDAQESLANFRANNKRRREADGRARLIDNATAGYGNARMGGMPAGVALAQQVDRLRRLPNNNFSEDDYQRLYRNTYTSDMHSHNFANDKTWFGWNMAPYRTPATRAAAQANGQRLAHPYWFHLWNNKGLALPGLTSLATEVGAAAIGVPGPGSNETYFTMSPYAPSNKEGARMERSMRESFFPAVGTAMGASVPLDVGEIYLTGGMSSLGKAAKTAKFLRKAPIKRGWWLARRHPWKAALNGVNTFTYASQPFVLLGDSLNRWNKFIGAPSADKSTPDEPDSIVKDALYNYHAVPVLDQNGQIVREFNKNVGGYLNVYDDKAVVPGTEDGGPWDRNRVAAMIAKRYGNKEADNFLAYQYAKRNGEPGLDNDAYIAEMKEYARRKTAEAQRRNDALVDAGKVPNSQPVSYTRQLEAEDAGTGGTGSFIDSSDHRAFGRGGAATPELAKMSDIELSRKLAWRRNLFNYYEALEKSGKPFRVKSPYSEQGLPESDYVPVLDLKNGETLEQRQARVNRIK